MVELLVYQLLKIDVALGRSFSALHKRRLNRFRRRRLLGSTRISARTSGGFLVEKRHNLFVEGLRELDIGEVYRRLSQLS